MQIPDLIAKTNSSPQSIEFTEVMEVINKNYEYTPSAFKNGELHSEAGSNEGSCKIFYFAQLNQLTELQTLSLFGAYYRDDVLKHPDNTDHGNIRNFMQSGWDKVSFEQVVLTTI